MSNEQPKLRRGKAYPDQEDELLVSDIVQYLSSLAKLHRVDKTGNPALSKGLQHLARALRPYMDRPVLELPDIIRSKETAQFDSKAGSHRARSLCLPGLESTSQEEIERILDDEGFTKQYIVEIGVQRFGISRSKLERLSNKDSRDYVRSALEHEKSLDVISREAQRSGMARTA